MTDVAQAIRTLTLCAALAVAGLTVSAAQLQAQILVGAHAVHAQDAFDGATGLGVRVGTDLPALPLAGFASYERFFPDCPAGVSDCALSGFTLDANFELTFPVIQPYAMAGLAWREFSTDEADESETGLALGAGVSVALGAVNAFGEARYEFLQAPERQFLLRLGLMLDLL